MPAKLQFLLRHRDQPWGYNGPYGYQLSSGLRNSVRFVVEMLHLMGIAAEWVECQDANAIDREVTRYKPTHVILEAFWVPPAKIKQLKPLHPYVTWCVRDHSETPFLANEGMVMEWVAGYLAQGVEVICNAPRALTDMQAIAEAYGYPGQVSYGPNYYPTHLPKTFKTLQPKPTHADDIVRVGCFGAIRPLKNQLLQAVAALRYASFLGKKLEFHINSARIEQGGNPILKNLQALFANAPNAKLVEAPWCDHAQFLDLLEQMDVLLQVSLSETFNIVSADAVICNVPVVVSREVPWLGSYAIADANDSTSIYNQMLAILRHPKQSRLEWQMRDLSKYTANTKAIWYDRFGRGGPVPNV